MINLKSGEKEVFILSEEVRPTWNSICDPNLVFCMLWKNIFDAGDCGGPQSTIATHSHFHFTLHLFGVVLPATKDNLCDNFNHSSASEIFFNIQSHSSKHPLPGN